MKTLFLLLCVWFLLIFWLSYRQQRKQHRAKRWAEKRVNQHSHKASGALQALKHDRPPAQQSEVTAVDICRPCSLNAEPPEALSDFNLIRINMLDEDRLQFAHEIIGKLKRPHPALQAIAQNISSDELIEVLHGSPDITAKILTTVNSAAFSLAQPITSINHAVIYLGMSIVKSIAMQFIVKQSLGANLATQQKAFQALWSQSYLSSSLSFLLAQSLSLINAAELSTKTLLANIGGFCLIFHDDKLAELYTTEPSLIKRISYEQQHLRINSTVLGSMLAKKWLLPETVQASIDHRLFPLKYNPNNKAFSDQEKHDLTFCYLVSRISEAIFYESIRDTQNYDLDKREELETFYLRQALTETGLIGALAVLKQSQFREKAKVLIQQAQGFAQKTG